MMDNDEMGNRHQGVIPSQELRAMIARGEISTDPIGLGPVAADQVQPASLDLRLGRRAWRVRASFLSGKGRSVVDRLADFAMHEVDLSKGAVLETGCVYVVELAESLALPGGIAAAANAKSSTGRLDLLTRLITDRSIEFDRVEAGYTGPLYAEISPLTFSVLVRPGMRLNQIRFRRGEAMISDSELRALNTREPLVNGDAMIDGGLGFSVDLTPRGDNGIVGWRARLAGAPALRADRPRADRSLRALRVLGADHPRAPRCRHPRPRLVLHPGQPRGRQRAARNRRRDGALYGHRR
jgi:dCTP deaminase